MDYELIDSGDGRRLERFGKYILDRPDPEVMWSKNLPETEWQKVDAKFSKTINDRGEWKTNSNFPNNWIVKHDDLNIILKLTPFKHTGCFPEQAWQWDLIKKSLKKDSQMLNLFGYTGIASLSALLKQAKVTHLDASKPAITWFKENQKLSKLDNEFARVIVDDAIKFTTREIKRGIKYDAIIMDPPVYGHGPNGEKWSFVKDFPILLENVSKLLSDNPIFVIVNAYAVSTSPTSLANIMQDKLKNLKGKVTCGELTLNEKSGKRTLSTGIWAMWQKN